MKDVLVFNGKSFSEFNTFFDGSKSFGTPEKEYEIISVPGRSGDLSVYKNRFKDLSITFPCFIRENFVENYRNLTEYLNGVTGYQRLETSKEPDYYRKALFLGSVTPKTGSFNHSGKFDITFRCNPQRWLKIGEEWTEYSTGLTMHIFNPTNQPAKPLIRMFGTGSITIGEQSFRTSGTDTYEFVEIDCDICDVYSNNNENLNSKFSGQFPVILPGDNQVRFVGSGYIKIQPRWYEI